MRCTTLPRIAVSTGLSTLVLGVAGCSFTTGGEASSDGTQAVETARTEAGAVLADSGIAPEGTKLEFQTGTVVEASGSIDEGEVSVSVVDNSIHGSTVSVAIGGRRLAGQGYAEQAQPYVRDGILRAVVDVEGEPFRVTGRLAPVGEPEKVSEQTRDSAGDRTWSEGTNTALAGKVVITYRGQRTALHLDRAMEYDLEVHRG